MLAEGQADAVVMTRALVSDPALPRKIAEPAAEPVRPHVGMTRYFSVQGDWNRPLGDLANPRAGREALLPPPLLAASAPQAMLVVGGGPAGLEAAHTLARLGHRVTLREARPVLGGMATVLADTVEARAEFAPLVAYHGALLPRLGVELRTGAPVAADEPGLDAYHTVYVATGATAPQPALPGGGLVLTPRTLLSEAPPLPAPEAGRVAVLDSEGGFRMANAVEWLLARGYGVDIITEDLFVGRELVESAEFLWFPRIAQQGAAQSPHLRALAYDGRALRCEERFSGAERTFGPVAFVVAAAPEQPADALADALRARHPRVVTLGDARTPRLMGEAILHAHRAVLLESPP